MTIKLEELQKRFSTLQRNVTGVAILLDSAPRTWTSMEEVNRRLCLYLSMLGITPVLVYAAELPADIEARMRAAGAKIEVVAYKKDRYPYYKQLGRIFLQYSINLSHVCFFDYYSLVPWLARLQGLRSIVYEELNSGMLRATSWKRKVLQLRTAVMTWPVSRIVAVSEFVKTDLVKRGVKADRIAVRYLAADEERFRPDPEAKNRLMSQFSIRENELIMSSVTLLRPFKSPETLVHTSALLAQRGLPAKLLVAGDGAMLSDLKELSAALGVADRINWLGFCKDPTTLIQGSDVFLLASVGEAGGFVLSEAMGCGTPIIGSRSGVISECVLEGHTGFLAEPKDPASFANAIEKFARSPQMQQAMRANSRRRMLENFTIDHNVTKTLEIYQDLNASHPRASS